MAFASLTIDLNARIANIERDMGRAAHVAETQSARMVSAFKGVATAGAGLAGLSSIMEVAGKLISVQREFDVLNSSLITVTGSSANAEKEFAWIKEFAATTPFSLAEVTGAFVKMKSLGLDASKESLASYGNTASAMGKSLNQMIEAVADASTGEFERLKEFGIKARKNGDEISLTFQGVTTTIKNSAEEITGYLTKIGNNQFAGAMATRAATLDGALSNLADTWDALFLTVSQSNTGDLIYDSVTSAAKAIEELSRIINLSTPEQEKHAEAMGGMNTAYGAFATTAQTLAVTGSNVSFVLRVLANDTVSALTATGYAMTAQFGMAKKTLDMAAEYARTQRATLDQYERSVLLGEKAANSAGTAAGGNAGKPTRSSDTKIKMPKPGKLAAERLDIIDPFGKERTAAELAARNEIIKRANDEAADEFRIFSGPAFDAETRALDDYRKRLESLISNTTLTKTEALQSNIDILNQAFFDGQIGAQQYEEAIGQLTGETNEKLKEQSNLAKELGLTFSSAFEDAALEGGKFSDVLKGIEKDVARIIVRKSVTEPIGNAVSSIFNGSSGAGGGGQNIFGSIAELFGFATGGSFTVGGSGGTDSQLVAFKATPGEMVNVQTPGQQQAGGGVTIIQNISVDSRSDRASIVQAMIQAKDLAKAEIYNSMQRGGSFARATGRA